MHRRTFLECLVAAAAWPAARAGSVLAAPVLEDLKGIDELKRLFNADAGRARLILLLSPT